MNVAELIADKRDGRELEPDRIAGLIAAYARDEVPDYQMSAFAMAVYFQGMTTNETVALTRAMLDSGDTMRWTGDRTRVDKHSTGGIGDKVSIPLAPLLAAADVDVPMISGRGLGITGGTLDKLESIRGFRCDLSNDEFRYVVNDCGCAIVSASKNLAIADKKLYALRDVTGTVPSIPLITASILSKKLAAGLDALVLDVKCGSGAFMKTQAEARALAESLVEVSRSFDVKTTALITDMNQPVGQMIGNANEIAESIELLQGRGPEDLLDLTVALGAEVLVAAGVKDSHDQAAQDLHHLIRHGDALRKFEQMIRCQDGDLKSKRRIAPQRTIAARESGYIERIQCDRLGRAINALGGGRKELGDPIDHAVGIEVLVRVGDRIESGQPLAHIFSDAPADNIAKELVELSFAISPNACPPIERILERIRNE